MVLRRFSGRRRSGLSWFSALALSVALAGCQNASTPTLTLGNGVIGDNPNQPAFQTDAHGAGDTYFTLALPVEPSLPRQVVEVSGTPGSFNTPLSSSASPVITSIIPNKTGFIVEGARLNTGALKFYLGSSVLTPSQVQPNQLLLTLPAHARTSGVFTARNGSVTLARAAVDAKNVYVTGRCVVQFVDGAPRASIENALKACGIQQYRYLGMNFVTAYFDPSIDFTTIQAKLLGQHVFSAATRDTLYNSQDESVQPETMRDSYSVQNVAVNDPDFSQQWALPMINAPSAWDYITGSPDAMVAILDTGIQLNHPDLQANIYTNTAETAGNNKDDDNNGYVDDVHGWNSVAEDGNVSDDNGHGTQMAGIIAASTNSIGVVGAAFNSRVIPVKVLDNQGIGTTSTIIDGIDYAVRNRASVILLAVASVMNDSALQQAVQFATTYNVLVVCSMGNSGTNVETYPAGWSGQMPVVAVGSTNSSDARSTWSNWGNWITVTAPGEGIITTNDNGSTVTISGTSPAAAYAAAEAAMIKAMKPDYTPAMIENLMETTAVDKGTPGFDNDYGYGRIQLQAGVQNLSGSMTIDASSEHQLGHTPASDADDQNTETYWSSARRDNDTPQWLELDMGFNKTLTSIALMSAPYYSLLFPEDFTIETSTDEKTWKPVVSETGFSIPESTWHRWNISPVSARYVRVNVTKSRQNPDNQLYYDQIAEVAVNGEENSIVMNSSSDYYGVYPSSNLTDGNADSYWVSSNEKSPDKAQFAIADMGASQSIKTISLLCPPSIISEAFPKDFTLSVSNDKVNWQWVKDVHNVKVQPGAWVDVPVPPTSGRYVRIDVPHPQLATSNGSLFGGFALEGYTAAVAEVQLNRPMGNGNDNGNGERK
ncbi:MAG TPA: S8 family serine peptidase [Oscillatoriaceae cyanobacterium]